MCGFGAALGLYALGRCLCLQCFRPLAIELCRDIGRAFYPLGAIAWVLCLGLSVPRTGTTPPTVRVARRKSSELPSLCDCVVYREWLNNLAS